MLPAAPLLAVAALLLVPAAGAWASHNPGLYVSAEDPVHGNHFYGPAVVEVIVRDSRASDTHVPEGEPDVTLNGRSLRMVQGSDGNWYAYFAHSGAARAADATAGPGGTGLDFGVFCSSETPKSVVGISLSDAEGFAVPHPGGLGGFADGDGPLSECTGSPAGTGVLNNVVRNAPRINTDPGVRPGQIGLDPGAWPLVQLFSFGDVTIEYGRGGSAQRVSLEYGEPPGISFSLDRERYPQGSEVFLTISDPMLNLDPTDVDSWTFGTGRDQSLFYRAFEGSSGAPADVAPHLPGLGFDDNGLLSVDPGSVLELRTNGHQPGTSITSGPEEYGGILTVVETEHNSGIFESADRSDRSTLGVAADAPRGHAGHVTYNDRSVSVLTGPSAASFSVEPELSIGGAGQLLPGAEYGITLWDPDQNTNSASGEDLDLFRPAARLPTLRIGDPVTLEHSVGADFFSSSADAARAGTIPVSAPDGSSARLFLDASGIRPGGLERISVDLGAGARDFSSALVDPSDGGTRGTNWLNYDLRSLAGGLGVRDLADAAVTVSFGSPGLRQVTVADPGDLASPQGLVQLDDDDVLGLLAGDGPAYLGIDFDHSNDTADAGTVTGEAGVWPIAADFVSFGTGSPGGINNAIYRFELEETSDDSATFEGTLEYFVAGSTQAADPGFVRKIRTIDDRIRFMVTDASSGAGDIRISYSDLDPVGVTATISAQQEVSTSSGTVSLGSQSYRFGQPVRITLDDPDLNLDGDRVDAYHVINNPGSDAQDTVGRNGEALLEVLIKGIRYQRCVIDGEEHGGLGASGFSMTETGPDTGRFEGVFKMPSWICNESGTALVSPAGGGIDVKYFDSHDDSGNPSTFGPSREGPAARYPAPPALSTSELVRPPPGGEAEIILSGRVASPARGVPLAVEMTFPDGRSESFASSVTGAGRYMAAVSIRGGSPLGTYMLDLSYGGADAGSASFTVGPPEVPGWVRDAAGRWASGGATDSEFLEGIGYLADAGLIGAPDFRPGAGTVVPGWMKSTAGWWAGGLISDDDFLGSVQYLLQKGVIGA